VPDRLRPLTSLKRRRPLLFQKSTRQRLPILHRRRRIRPHP